MNAYVEPLVSLDLDLVVAVDRLEQVEALLNQHFDFQVRQFPHSLNIAMPGSDLRIRIQTDPRYSSFVDRASIRTVLGMTLPVASLEDVLPGRLMLLSF